MEPAFYRGDLLFLTNPAHQRYLTGDITVYKIPGADIPIVHRVLETHDIIPNAKHSESKHAFVSLSAVMPYLTLGQQIRIIGPRIRGGGSTIVDER